VRLERVEIPTPTVPLDGLLYWPEGKAQGGVLYFHGNQMNFYTGPARFLPPRLVEVGFAVLAFNRRGHDTVSTRDSRKPVGGAFQTVAEGLEDNELAGRYLARRGFPDPVVVGHSNGGLLGACYAARHPEVRALVLLSAHAGGPEFAQRLSRRGLWAGDRLADITRQAEDLVAQGRGTDLLLLPGWWHVTSAQTFLDYSRNCPDLLEQAPRIQCPVLFVRGEEEPEEVYPAHAFVERCAGPAEAVVLSGCDHFYTGAEDRVAALVSEWLLRRMPGRPEGPSTPPSCTKGTRVPRFARGSCEP
jgi:pimeloyl-ACP methyl ester carboxylesterase